MLKSAVSVALTAASVLLQAENVVRNGAFDYSKRHNGSDMRVGMFDNISHVREMQAQPRWISAPFEGWWVQSPEGGTIAVEDGGGFLRLTGNGVLHSVPRPLAAPDAVLSADVRTNGLKKGVLSLESLHLREDGNTRTAGAKHLGLPNDTGGKFVRLHIPYEGLPGETVALRILMSEGTVELDNVRIGAGLEEKAFEVRPGDMLDLQLGKYPSDRFPRFFTAESGKQPLVITNKARNPISGKLTVYLDVWNKPGKTVFLTRELADWKHGETIACDVETGKLPPDGYIILAELTDESGNILISKDIYDPTQTGSGKVGNSMLAAHNGIRFGVYPDTRPARLYGIANGMIGQGSWYHGVRVDDFATGKELGVAGYHGYDTEDELFSGAVGGAQLYSCYRFDRPDRPELTNPAYAKAVDIYNPEARKLLDRRAEELGKLFGEGPGYAGMKMRNESIYPGDSCTYPTVWADKAFREWCQERYGTLENLNRNWNGTYTDWEQVVQIVSADMAEDKTMVAKSGGAALDWTANMGRFTPQIVKLMNDDPGRGMDWCRWRTETSLETYARFRNIVKKHAPDTLVGVNFCWPNFWPQFVMRFWRATDAPMLDVQYTARISVDLGTADEMLDIMEMAESTVSGKPIWGIETYIQPSFPAEFAPMQNWGLLAHGMTYNYIFSWKAYSDMDQNIKTRGVRAWEKKGAEPMWFIIDNDGTKLPAFHTNQRSLEEIAAFHRKYDGFSVKRISTKTAVYLPDDTAEFVIMTTGNKPFNSSITSSRVTLGGQMRMNGVTLDYMDDDALMKLDGAKHDTLFIPPSPVMSDEALAKIAGFVREGGTAVFMGPCGVYDPYLRVRKEFAGGLFSNGDWLIPAKWKSHLQFIGDYGANTREGISSVKDFPALPGAAPVRFSDGTAAGNVRSFGKGKVYVMTRWADRYRYSVIQPTAELRKYMKELIALLKLPVPAVWESGDTPEAKGYGRVGEGAPYVEAVIREQAAGSRFLFALNQGGAGKGRIVLADGNWNVTDVLTGKPVKLENGAIELDMPALNYRVFRLTR